MLQYIVPFTKKSKLIKNKNWSLLKGLGNIVQMRDSGSKVVTSMLDVQLKIIWKFEWKRTIIHGTN